MADEATSKDSGRVYDSGKGSWADLFRKEDYWAIWLGFLLIAVGLVLFLGQQPEGMEATINEANAAMEAEAERVPFKSLAWYEAHGKKAKLKSTDLDFAKLLKEWTSKPHGWKVNPLEAFYLSEADAEARNQAAASKYEAAKKATKEQRLKAVAAEGAAGNAEFNDVALNEEA